MATTSHNDGWMSHVLNPYVLFGIAGFTGVGWAVAFNTQIFTNGVGMLAHEGASRSTLFPFWVWDQVALLANDATPDVMRMAIIAALFVQAVQLVISLGIGAALQIVQSRAGIHLSPSLSKEAMVRNFFFVTFALLIFAIDAVFDWSYGQGDIGAHALFSLAVNFCSFFFLPATIICVRAGLILKQP